MRAVSVTGFRCILIALTALFAVRVIAQVGSMFFSVDWIPAFDRWSSGLIPYPLLLVSQLLILASMIAGCCSKGRWHPADTTIWVSKQLAGLYFLIMCLRLVVSISGVSSSPWWQMTLPAFFHLVLASYLYCIAEFHKNLSSREETSHEYLK